MVQGVDALKNESCGGSFCISLIRPVQLLVEVSHSREGQLVIAVRLVWVILIVTDLIPLKDLGIHHVQGFNRTYTILESLN